MNTVTANVTEWAWWVSAWVLGAGAVGVLAWAIFGGPPRGRRR